MYILLRRTLLEASVGPSGAQVATGIFDWFWGSPGRLVGVICAPVGALVVIFGPLDRLLKGLGPTFKGNLVEK